MTMHGTNVVPFPMRGALGVTDLRGRRVLVVEDQYCIAGDVAEALIARGAEVIGPVPTVDKALDMVETNRLDGAILDIDLRGEIGYAVADALASRAIPFVFATGCDQRTVPARFRQVPFCEKPFDSDQVVRTLFTV